MTVADLDRRLDAEELAHWLAYFELTKQRHQQEQLTEMVTHSLT